MASVGAPELTPRQREVLRRVVEHYVETGEPAGSRTLVERGGLMVSPSTVRAELAEHLKSCLLRPGVAGNLRKRGMAQLKRLYKQQGDLDALFALQEDEVQALEGALSEARIEQR